MGLDANTIKEKSRTPMKLNVVLFLIFLTLKLTNYIDWSWWWVTSPLWIPLAVIFGFLLIIFLIALIVR